MKNNQNFQVNQIYRDKLFGGFYLVTQVNSKFLTLLDLTRNREVHSSPNSIFMYYCIYIGTSETHPELLI